MLLYDIVGPERLQSAVRLNATVRYLGVLIGPAVGSLIMLTLGPTRGIFLNASFYLPLLVWLIAAPYGRHFRKRRAAPSRAVRGLWDILETIRDIRAAPALGAMVLLAGAASFFVGNSYQAQMPGFAEELGHGDPGIAYTLLLAADAAGALLGGFLLESRSGVLPMRSATALKLSIGWAASLLAFALARSYFLALPLLFVAGFFELSFSSMAQTIVQMNAPDALRGRVLGLFGMASSGLRTFSGVTVGLAGSVLDIHTSLASACAAFIGVSALLLFRARALASA
jgi:MFS family permease